MLRTQERLPSKPDLHIAVGEDLDAFGLTERIGPEHLYMTMPTAVASYVQDFTAQHGRPPVGAPTPT